MDPQCQETPLKQFCIIGQKYVTQTSDEFVHHLVDHHKFGFLKNKVQNISGIDFWTLNRNKSNQNKSKIKF